MQVNELKLIEDAKKGDDFAFEQLLKQYKNLVNSISRRYFLVGGDVDDLLQEGMIGLFKAVKTYNPNKNSSFASFANTVVERQIINAIKKANSQKNLPLSDYVALNHQGGIEGEEGSVYYLENVSANPEIKILKDDDVKQMLKTIYNLLSNFERKILEEYLKGYSYTQIAQNLHKSPKSIDNALNRIKNKLKGKLK